MLLHLGDLVVGLFDLLVDDLDLDAVPAFLTQQLGQLVLLRDDAQGRRLHFLLELVDPFLGLNLLGEVVVQIILQPIQFSRVKLGFSRHRNNASSSAVLQL